MMEEGSHLAHQEDMRKWFRRHKEALLEGVCSALQIAPDSSFANTHFVCVVLKASEIISPASSYDALSIPSQVSLCIYVFESMLRSRGPRI